MKTSRQKTTWVPTPTFLYRNYRYKKMVDRIKKDSYFLEVGPGNGDFLKHLIKKGYRGEAIDISEKSIQDLKKDLGEIPGIKIKKDSIFTYKSAKKFDLVSAFEVLEHIENDEGAIKRIYSLLTPGGKFLVSIPAKMKEWTNIDVIKGHYRRYEREELHKKLRDAGFKKIKIVDYGFPFLSFLRRISKEGGHITTFTQGKSKQTRGKESGIQQEYYPFLRPIVTFPLFTYPFFFITDLFLNSGLGFGLIASAEKPKK